MNNENAGHHSEKKELYYGKVIALHKKGYCATDISRVVPVSRQTAANWIATFAVEEQASTTPMRRTKSGPGAASAAPAPQTQPQARPQPTASQEIRALQREIRALQKENKDLRALAHRESMRADLNDEMINVAEAMFNIRIRKKAGAGQ